MAKKSAKQEHAPAANWLVKSEPSAFSWQDLLAQPKQTTCWDGVRNYQARNYLRDGFQLHDRVFFYQSCTKPLAVVGCMRVVRVGYADPSQFDPTHPAFDAASRAQAPRWWAVDVRAEFAFASAVTLEQIRQTPACASMPLLARGSRLSVQPVPAPAARALLALAQALHAPTRHSSDP